MTPEAIDLNKNPVLGMLMNTQAFNTKIVELAGVNFNSAVKYAEEMSKVRSGQFKSQKCFGPVAPSISTNYRPNFLQKSFR